MRYLSVCSGIEAATVAWHPLGWESVGFSEIDRFPSAVLKHHYPDVPNYGDMNDHEKWPETDIDVLVGGTPCQSFSVAGLRAGMADPRGNLSLVYLAIADQYKPRWLVWENVPGILSSDGGRDFGSIIGGMVELGYSPCWRVLDAQYFGVAQRRRRVFVVASSRDWRDSFQVLFEPESLRRDPAPSRETGQGIAKSTVGCLAESSGHARPGDNIQSVDYLIPDVANPLTARMHKGINTTADERQTPIVSFNWQNGGGYGNANEGLGIDTDRAGPCSRSQVQAVAFDTTQVTSKENRSNPQPGDPCHPLAAGAHAPAIANDMAVRRLTPVECERLQGFPDNYTNIPWRGKETSPDGPRYKALGNSMAVPVMHWIGRRINDT